MTTSTQTKVEPVVSAGPIGPAGLIAGLRDRMVRRHVEREFDELIANYHSLVNSRAITYPVSYQFIKELGHGRQGVVFLATRHCSRGCITKHAIKLFDPSIYSSAQKYWTDMGRIASQISLLQPINSIYLASGDFYEECNGVGYVQMQAIDGIDLHFLLNHKQIELARARATDEEWDRFMSVLFRLEGDKVSLRPGLALYIIRDVLRGLAVLHDNGFIHGDVKPTNVMMDVNGQIKVVDLGRAVRIGEHVKIFLGSPLYMAPEIHRHEPGFEQSDLFSVGLLALEMLKGRQITAMANLNDAQLQEFKNNVAGSIAKYLPDDVLKNWELTQVLARFLDPQADDRFANAHEAEYGAQSLISVSLWLKEEERDIDYELEISRYLEKLVDPDTGTLNPHFASDNLTAVIITTQ